MRRLRVPIGFAAVLALASTLAAQSGANTNSKSKRKDPDQIGNRDVGKGLNLYSIQKEIELGKTLAQDVEQKSKVIGDPQISEFINRVAQNLARNSDAKIPLTAKVSRGEDINALSLPGGHLYVNTGLILTADTEAELAGAMSHEIGHIAARHGTRQASREQVTSLAAVPLMFMGGWAGLLARQAANDLGVPVVFLSFSRGFESEADLLGVQYMYKAGYDPVGLVDIFEKINSLAGKKPGRVSVLFSDHPPTGDRIVSVQKNIQTLLKDRPEYLVNTSEFDRVKARLLELENQPMADPDPNRPRLRATPKLTKSLKSGSHPCV